MDTPYPTLANKFVQLTTHSVLYRNLLEKTQEKS